MEVVWPVSFSLLECVREGLMRTVQQESLRGVSGISFFDLISILMWFNQSNKESVCLLACSHAFISISHIWRVSKTQIKTHRPALSIAELKIKKKKKEHCAMQSSHTWLHSTIYKWPCHLHMRKLQQMWSVLNTYIENWITFAPPPPTLQKKHTYSSSVKTEKSQFQIPQTEKPKTVNTVPGGGGGGHMIFLLTVFGVCKFVID